MTVPLVRRRWFALPVLAGILAIAGIRGEESPPPRDIGLTEKVQVRLVTLDVTVIDQHDRAVGGLGLSDFLLEVDGHPLAVDTLDETCPGGGLDDAVAVRTAALRSALPTRGEPRKIALVLDYTHLTLSAMGPGNRTQRELALESGGGDPNPLARTTARLRELLQSEAVRGDEILLAAFTGGLRIEQPFTCDTTEVLKALDRMDHDVSLWNGRFHHETEEGFFAGLEGLLDVLAVLPGPKAMVLFTLGPGPGSFYEPQLRHLGALAADARVSIYPVDCGGLETRGFT
jgi:VWFA-related protein